MQHGQEDGRFDVEAEAAPCQQGGQDVVAAGLLPEALKDQRRADAAGGDGRQLAVGMSRQQQGLLGEAGAGGEQGVELARGLEQVQASEGGKDALFGLAVIPVVLDELEVAAWPGGFDAEEQGGLGKRDTMMIGDNTGNSREKPGIMRVNVAPGIRRIAKGTLEKTALATH